MDHPSSRSLESCPDSSDSDDSILFKNHTIYSHQILRVNYTTYNVRRTQDVIHTGSSQSNIMCLTTTDDSEVEVGNTHRFCYGRVLGIYHANVIHTGSRLRDYHARRLEFLWVRWYRYADDSPRNWDHRQLDRLQFPPVASEDAFGFIDPADVLRACHVLPRISHGRVHADGIGISRCARDSSDWRMYYINR